MQEIINKIQNSSDLTHEEKIVACAALRTFNPTRQIAIIWDIYDVQEIRPDLDDTQAMRILREADDTHDADYGITWEIIDKYAQQLYPPVCCKDCDKCKLIECIHGE